MKGGKGQCRRPQHRPRPLPPQATGCLPWPLVVVILSEATVPPRGQEGHGPVSAPSLGSCSETGRTRTSRAALDNEDEIEELSRTAVQAAKVTAGAPPDHTRSGRGAALPGHVAWASAGLQGRESRFGPPGRPGWVTQGPGKRAAILCPWAHSRRKAGAGSAAPPPEPRPPASVLSEPAL